MIHRSVLSVIATILATTMLFANGRGAHGQDAGGEVSSAELVTDDVQKPILFSGDFEETYASDDGQVHLIIGHATLTQGTFRMSGQKLAVFVARNESGFDVRIYGENVAVDSRDGHRDQAFKVVRLESLSAPEFRIEQSIPGSKDNPLLRKAVNRLFPGESGEVSTVSLQVPQDSFSLPVATTPSTDSGATRRVQIRPRSSDPLRFESFESRDTVPAEQVNVITGGVNVLVEGVYVPFGGEEVSLGVIDISADRVVVWTQAGEDRALEAGIPVVQPSESKLQIYMEGNIVIRQKQNVIEATHAFFDANSNRALMLNAELRAFLPTTQGDFRIRAKRMRMQSQEKFHAQDAWATTSPYGEPGYRIEASDIFVAPGPSLFSGTDPFTGQPVLKQSTWVTSHNNKFVVGDVPVFYLPKISGPAEDPGIPIRRAVVTSDSIFGVQAKTVWNMNRLFGIPKQPGMEWDLLANYMSDRGPGIGTAIDYSGTNQLGPWKGNGIGYYQYDSGRDNLGLDRRNLTPDSRSRGEATFRYRQNLPGDALIFGEIGYLSDRNYLEQYQESRFDTDKDVETVLGARQDLGAYSGVLWGRADLNGFEATTDWLPRADLYSFSKPLFNGLLYWSSHSSAGYADTQQLPAPNNPNDPYTPLGMTYNANASGVVAMSRHEIAAPFMMGPINLEPFVMGEAAYWQQGFTSDSIDRYLMNTGVRARMTATKVFPFVRSDILNLNGLAHKHDTFLEYAFTQSSRGLNEIAQYNEIDDNSQERFRVRYTTQVFPGVIPAEFNSRNYALRNGAGLWTSAPYHEIADDFQALRIGFRDRLQTKVGPADAPRIRDWMTWEYGASFYPKSDRDNFGEDFGLLYNHSRWNISDRTSLLTDTNWDLFDNAQNLWSVGVLSQRSLRGSLYLGFRQVKATNYFDSQTLIGSYSYQMSPKWISTASYAYDVAASESRGSSLTVSRVGLDWILHFGVGFDFSKDNVGLGVSFEPRFGPPSPTNLSYLLGIQ
jgi:hypothetical protein